MNASEPDESKVHFEYLLDESESTALSNLFDKLFQSVMSGGEKLEN